MFRPFKKREYGSTAGIVTALVHGCGGAKVVKDHFKLDALSVVYSWTDKDAGISFDRVRDLTETFGVPLAAEALAADAGGFFTPGEPPSEAVERLVANEAREQGELLHAVMVWIERHRDRASREKVAADLDQLIMTLSALRARVRA